MERNSAMKCIGSQQSHSSLRLGKPNYTELKCYTAKGTSQSDLQISQNENRITP